MLLTFSGRMQSVVYTSDRLGAKVGARTKQRPQLSPLLVTRAREPRLIFLNILTSRVPLHLSSFSLCKYLQLKKRHPCQGNVQAHGVEGATCVRLIAPGVRLQTGVLYRGNSLYLCSCCCAQPGTSWAALGRPSWAAERAFDIEDSV